jgi:N-acetylglucosamine kinase-like BadF-type ATPase
MVVVGVDGGTTKTIALVADLQGNILSAARGGGSNWTGEDVEIPMAVVIQTVREALAKAGQGGEDVEMGVFTLAGADWLEDHQRREAVLAKAGIARRVKVKNDSFGGLRAGLRKPYGMVLAAGTGMNAAVITPDGREWAFGYYETFGGAGTIVQDAFAALLRAEDGRGQPTQLTAMLLDALGYPSVEALLRDSVVDRLDRGKFYATAPLVFQAALAGDAVAVEIIVNQGRGLAEYISAMARRFEMTALEFDVVLAGSVFKGTGPLLVDTIVQEIHRTAPRANIVRAQFEPAVGSVLLAYDALEIPVGDEIYARLAKTAPDERLFDTARGSRPAPIRSQAGLEEK